MYKVGFTYRIALFWWRRTKYKPKTLENLPVRAPRAALCLWPEIWAVALKVFQFAFWKGAAVFGLHGVPKCQCSAPESTQRFSEQGVGAQASLLQTLSPSQGWTETKNELHALIREPQNSGHLFCQRGMIGSLWSSKEKDFKNSLQLSSVPYWGRNGAVGGFHEPKTSSKISGFEIPTSYSPSLLANLPMHPVSSTLVNCFFHFQVSFWSSPMHGIFFSAYFFFPWNQKLKSQCELSINHPKPCFRPEEWPHELQSWFSTAPH